MVKGQLQAEVNTLKQKIREFNAKQLSLRTEENPWIQSKQGSLPRSPKLICSCWNIPKKIQSYNPKWTQDGPKKIQHFTIAVGDWNGLKIQHFIIMLIVWIVKANCSAAAADARTTTPETDPITCSKGMPICFFNEKIFGCTFDGWITSSVAWVI